MTRRALLWVCVCAAIWPLRLSLAQTPQDQLTPEQLLLVEEHAFGGLPTDGPILVRQGYVSGYNSQMRVPKWVAFHVKPEYRDTPKRQGKFSSFRQDPDVSSPVKDADYNGLLASLGYARGHLAPYAVMGGDRDGDGIEAADDEYDAGTIFEANYMSNIAPQHQKALNGSGGLWYSLERWIQDDVVVTGGEEIWVFAGCIFGPGETEKVGPQKNIGVPPLFYQIVLKSPAPGQDAPKVLAFLFPHQRAKHGAIQDFLVSVDVIESMTGLDFLPDLEDGQRNGWRGTTLGTIGMVSETLTFDCFLSALASGGWSSGFHEVVSEGGTKHLQIDAFRRGVKLEWKIPLAKVPFAPTVPAGMWPHS